MFLAERNSSGDHILGGLDHGQILGAVGFHQKEAENQNHRGYIWFVYVYICMFGIQAVCAGVAMAVGSSSQATFRIAFLYQRVTGYDASRWMDIG